MIIKNVYNCFLKFKNYCSDCLFLPKKIYFYKWLSKLCEFFNIKKYIIFIFVNKKYILYLNNKFRNKNIVTDILSFSYTNIQNNYLGDVFICPSLILEKSFKKNINYFFYFAYLLIHSLLHLLGFNHNKFYNSKIMRYTECFFLFKLKKIYFLENLLVNKIYG